MDKRHILLALIAIVALFGALLLNKGHEQIGSVFIGISLFITGHLWKSYRVATPPSSKANKSRDFVVWGLNYILLLGNFIIALYALTFIPPIDIPTEGNKMTSVEWQQINVFIHSFIVLIWIVVGLVIGAGLWWVWEFFFGKKGDKTPETKTSIETTKQKQQNSEPQISIDLKINSADIPKMSPSQSELMKEIIDKLQGKTTQEK
ncbi:MAG: hypothetical protein HY529_00730 [Chloroflexi bacterium]|nr:hypothetical protein [Chloroflexota bacterium]